MDYDEGLKKSVIDQMMGELDDETAGSLKKPAAPVKGVEIAITVSPHSGDEESPKEVECGEEGCTDPAHNHPHNAEGEMSEEEHNGEDDYINQLMKKLG